MIGNAVRWGASAVALLIALAVIGGPNQLATGAESPAKEKPALVDINTASAADLEKLPGVGPALSKRIIEYREKNGPFATVDDLLKVQGIGEKSLARFRDLVTASKPPRK
jgi:competence protein ComEA